jgi:ferric-dicitrate binding protein FerR (iron transport regulator)
MENYIKILYKKFLYGTIRKEEFLEMRHELNKSDLPELKNLLVEAWNEDMNSEVMAEKDKEDIRSKLNFYVEYDKKRLFRKRMAQIAAVVIPFVFILSAVLYVFQPTAKVEKDFVVTVKQGNRAQVTLPDQSKVWMNSNSKLIYRNGKNNTREVKLVGEAFFKVVKDKNRPFIVSANNLQVEVLGTSFNVNARQGSDIIETSLVEGSIKLTGSELSQDYLLKPNEKAIYSNSLKSLKIEATDNEVETAWKDNKLQFRSERFGSVVKRLEEWYGVKIISKCPNIENDLISGAFKGESLETVLETFAIQYKIKYNHQSDTLVILYN